MGNCVCGQDMLHPVGCGIKFVYANGKRYNRIPVGDARDFGPGSKENCGDCNAPPGGVHHWGCDCERCPACGLQLISCDCEDVYIEGS